MDKYCSIEQVHGREILDSRGNPTVEVEVELLNGCKGRASVPSGASTGKFEAMELRDKDDRRYHGKGVIQAIEHVNGKLFEAIKGECVLEQEKIDALLRNTDSSDNKANIGANAMLGVSMAVARAAADCLEVPLYRYLGGCYAKQLPVPMMNILNGGCHADNTVDFQEFMIMPVGAHTFQEALQMGAEIYQNLKKILTDKHLTTTVGDEGGFAPHIKNSYEVLGLLMEAIEKSGFIPKEQVAITMDAAASELYDESTNSYFFPGESQMEGKSIRRTPEEMIVYYEELCKNFPVISIEDGLEEADWNGWQLLTKRLGDTVQLVGDDLFVTNISRLQQGILHKAANSILIKVNQIGTLSESFDTIEQAKKAGYGTIISHRSGETEDSFIADLAVAVNAGQIKTGAPCRSERTAKYNQLLRIEESLGTNAVFLPPFC